MRPRGREGGSPRRRAASPVSLALRSGRGLVSLVLGRAVYGAADHCCGAADCLRVAQAVPNPAASVFVRPPSSAEEEGAFPALFLCISGRSAKARPRHPHAICGRCDAYSSSSSGRRHLHPDKRPTQRPLSLLTATAHGREYSRNRRRRES